MRTPPTPAARRQKGTRHPRRSSEARHHHARAAAASGRCARGLGGFAGLFGRPGRLVQKLATYAGGRGFWTLPTARRACCVCT